jgi:hypothetical protein
MRSSFEEVKDSLAAEESRYFLPFRTFDEHF